MYYDFGRIGLLFFFICFFPKFGSCSIVTTMLTGDVHNPGTMNFFPIV